MVPAMNPKLLTFFTDNWNLLNIAFNTQLELAVSEL